MLICQLCGEAFEIVKVEGRVDGYGYHEHNGKRCDNSNHPLPRNIQYVEDGPETMHVIPNVFDGLFRMG